VALSHKDLLTLLDYSPEQIEQLLEYAGRLKRDRATGGPQPLAGRTGVLIFEKPSLRTRITFETAINELGGHAINLEAAMVRMGQRESVADVSRNLERWVHLIVARTFAHQTVVDLAEYSSIPVVNALTDLYHPCQALAFGLTVREHRLETRPLTVAFVGDGNNVCCSIMILCAKLGHNFVLACPSGYEPPRELTRTCSEIAARRGVSVSVVNRIEDAIRNASVIYTDVWTSMGQEEEAAERMQAFAPFQLNGERLRQAPDDVLVSHCLPAHRGEEITSEVLDSQHSVAFDEAENRLHAQKAVICHLFSQDKGSEL
jgi:ornithine carbamoyltransferase